MDVSRRQFLKVGLAGAGTLMLARPDRLWAATNDIDPHFFLSIIMVGGADTSYMFDARPLAMTKAGKIQNYLGEEPTPWTGKNGVTTLASSLVNPLKPYRDYFSILNGVMMAPNFDGHDQNMNLLMTGSNFGGESFIPHLNLRETNVPPAEVDAIIDGFLPSTLTNIASTVPLSPSSAEHMRMKLNTLRPAVPGDPLLDFINSRYVARSQGTGRLAQATSLMLDGFKASPALQAKMKNLKPLVPDAHPQRQFSNLISDCFRLGLARSAVWAVNDLFDSHAYEIARAQPTMFAGIMDRLSIVLKGLVETPYDAARSMMDVTTVMITSEFGRTMKIENSSVDRTGTNHNCLANTVLLGGKGIRGGQVIGASDYQSADEKLSPSHLSLDTTMVKAMGRPFDFKTFSARKDLPAAFNVADHMTIASVINTLYKLAGNPVSRYRPIYTNLPTAPTLDQLLR